MLRIEGLKKSFGDLPVLKGIDAEIKKGEIIGIIGSSGQGKSVLLRSLAMLHSVDEGEIYIEGVKLTYKNLNQLRRKMGMVYQEFNLFSHMSIIENLILAPRKIHGISKEQAIVKARELLELVGLSNKENAMPSELSGGQKQRVAIARCLAMEPQLILFDEPTSALDPSMTSEVLAIIRQLKSSGLTMLIVTHEMRFICEVADRIFFLDEGIIYEEGTPNEIFESPKRKNTIAFIKKLKQFCVQINGHDFDFFAMQAEIDLFLEKYLLSRKSIYRVQLILEELLNVLLKQLFTDVTPNISIAIEYFESDATLVVFLSYKARNLNVLTLLDSLAATLVSTSSKEIVHHYQGGENHLEIKL